MDGKAGGFKWRLEELMNYIKVAREILDYVGGRENVKEVTHCFTRLRFVLRDKSKAEKKALERTEGVISVVEGGGQLQIVIGNKVESVYDEVIKLVGTALPDTTDGDKKPWVSAVFQVLSASFTPLVPAIAASGLLKGILTAANLIAKSRGIDITGTDTYTILFAASQIIFYYMPIFLACTAAKAMKTSPFSAMVIGGLLVYPQMDAIVQNVAEKTSIFIFPVIKGSWQIGDATRVFSYTESVIPILLVVVVLKYLEKFLKKAIPEVVQVILVPGLSLIVMVPLTYTVLGPVGIYIGNGIQVVYNGIIGFNQILGGAVIGGFWCAFVAFGAHRALVPISINDVAVAGRQTLMAMSSPANFAQGGAALGVMLKTKNKELRSVAASTSLTAALAGITEPALYGCNLRLKKPMFCAMASGALGGAIIGWGGVYAESHVNGCLLTAVAYAAGGGGKFLIYMLGCGIAFFGAAALTYIVGFEDDPETENRETKKEDDARIREIAPDNADISIGAPAEGRVLPIEQMNDQVFSSGALGKGVAIYPQKGLICAPDDCEVSVIYETGHALGLKLDTGVELLIHIGIDTVELKGKYFHIISKEKTHVKRGAELVSFDIEEIKNAGYDPTIAVIVSNTPEFQAISGVYEEHCQINQDIIRIRK